MDRDLEKAGVSIQKAKESMMGESFQHLIHEGERKMIFLSVLVQLPIINAHPPPGDRPGGDFLSSFSLDNGHSTFLWNHVNRANPLAIEGSINIVRFTQFQNFLLDNLLEVGVQPPLRLN